MSGFKKSRWILSCFLSLFMLSWASAQTATISLELNDVSIKEVLKEIESQSHYTFAYVDTEVNSSKQVSISVKNQSIKSIIEELLPNVKMEVKGNKIILSPKPQEQTPSMAQTSQRKIEGVVTDEKGQKVVGAAIILEGTNIGTTSDVNGNYTLNLPKKDSKIVVSLIGYKDQIISISSTQTRLNIHLESDNIEMEDVVVVGYGVQNRRDVTTSISSIKAKDFESMSTSDFRDAMAAKMPGVQVMQLGGQPDGNLSIRVRGIQSATSGNDPLYVIDGIPCDARSFSNIESNDIESLEVLKDASAAAIYGSRGSCGVVLVTTKRGQTGRPVIHYDGQVSVSEVNKTIDMLDAYEFAQMFKESRDGAYLFNVPGGSIDDPYEDRPQVYHRVDPLITAYLQDKTGTMTNTDWQDAIFRTAISTKHSVSVSGGSKDLKYYIGANYLYREGVIIGSDFTRYSLRANIDGKRNRLKYGLNFSPSYSKTNFVDSDAQYGGDGVIASALMAPPVFPIYNQDGSYNWDTNGFLRVNSWDTQTNEVLNPVALAMEIDDVREKVNFLGNVYVGYEFIKGLEYKLSVGGNYYNYLANYYRPSYIPLRGYRFLDNPSEPIARHNSNSYFQWTVSNQLSFNRSFGDHKINTIAVYEAEKQTIQTAQIQGIGTIGDDKIRTTKGKTIDLANTFNNKYSYTFASWLLRFQYAYRDKYMISASIRGDGSSRFAPDTRWGYFPALSLGWRISDENFLKDVRWIDDLKLRVSVGQTGNAQIGNSEYLALYGTASLDLGNGLVSQVYPQQIANNDLGWEKNTQYNVGLDVSLWQGLFGMTLDYYHSKTTDMLFNVPVSSLSGLKTSNINIGSMQNQGVELQLSSRHRFGDFSYSVTANWSLNRNKVLSLGNENADIIKESSYRGGYYITRVGEPVGSYFLLVQDGIFHNREELDSYPHFETTQVGDFRFIDANGNGILEKDDDRVIVGNYMPDFYYGFSINLGWKGIDLSANFQGVYGNEILNLERRYLLNLEASSNMMKESLQRFPYGELNRATRKSSGNNGACTSTFHLEDGSYLRLQNLSIGYTLPERWTRKLGLSNLKIYFQGTNLFTWTDYTGYNPEVNRRAADALRPGEDYCSYPLSRSFSFGLKFNM